MEYHIELGVVSCLFVEKYVLRTLTHMENDEFMDLEQEI